MNSTFGERLQEALNFRNKKAAELASGTGLSQSLISQYLSDKFEAKNDKALLIANYLNVNVMWLMGLGGEMIEQSFQNSQWGNHEANLKYLKDKPELEAIYNEMVKRDDIYILFDKSKDLEPKDVESVLMFVQTIRKQRGFEE